MLPCWSLLLLYECRLQGLGFERGWGDTAEHVLEMMHLLLDILHAPDPSTLETFLGRVPMVFNVVILSPHGYFGQANVLGLPDTGGQVCSESESKGIHCYFCFIKDLNLWSSFHLQDYFLLYVFFFSNFLLYV